MQTKNITAIVIRANEPQRTVEAVVSDDSIDRYGEIVEQKSWKLDEYRRNPVILFSHDVTQPIGSATSIEVRNGKLHATIKFAETERAEEVYQLFRGGHLRAFSVGFRPGRIRKEKRGDREVPILLDCELLEVSAVAVPANANALAVSVKSAGVAPAVVAVAAPDDADRWALLAQMDAATRAKHGHEPIAFLRAFVGGSKASRPQRYEDFATNELHQMANEDRARFDALRAAHVTERNQ